MLRASTRRGGTLERLSSDMIKVEAIESERI